MLVEDYLQKNVERNVKGSSLYQSIAQYLRNGINDGSLDEVEILPSERDLANILNVSRVTIRKAIQLLVSEGLLIQRQGAGNFIARRMQQPLRHLTSFTEDMAQRNFTTSVVWLERTVTEPSSEERKILMLDEGEMVSRLYRLRTANEEAMALEMAVLPVGLIPNPEELNGSLYEYLGQQGNRPVQASQRLRAVPCATEHATFLRVSAGSPVLYIERVSYQSDDSPVEFTRSYYRGDSYDFISEMAIKPN